MRQPLFLLLLFCCGLAAKAQPPVPPLPEDAVYDKVEVTARFTDSIKGGFREFMYKKLRFPEILLDSLLDKQFRKTLNTQQTAIVVFTVDTFGHVSDVWVSNEAQVHPLYAKEAIRLIVKTNGLWIPGRQKGRAVKSYMRQPVTFVAPEF